MTGATAAVLAHEMGHNFGFEHDDELTRTCACDDPSYGRCIMISSVNVKLVTSTLIFQSKASCMPLCRFALICIINCLNLLFYFGQIKIVAIVNVINFAAPQTVRKIIKTLLLDHTRCSFYFCSCDPKAGSTSPV